jgi:hypothetical protein
MAFALFNLFDIFDLLFNVFNLLFDKIGLNICLYLPSEIISLNHNDIDEINVNKAKVKKYSALLNE